VQLGESQGVLGGQLDRLAPADNPMAPRTAGSWAGRRHGHRGPPL